MIVENNAQYSDQVSADSVSEDLALPATPLARKHMAQKHAYPLNEYSHNSIDIEGFDEIHIDRQLASLAVEAAISIVINGIHYAVLMASPSQLEYLAVGFLFSEGLIEHSHELLDWEVTQLTDSASFENFTENSIDETNVSMPFEQLQDYDVYVVELVLNQRCHQRIQAQKRQLAGRTGCGMCGITGLTQALPDLSGYAQNKQQNAQQVTTTKPSLDSLLNIRAQVDAKQHMHQLTGAVHAAATMQGQHLHLFEDVGRHNALDKLIGWQLRHKVEVECVVMSSRLSIELVQKSIRAYIPWLVGMSAPTSTAVRVAQRYGLGLAGFLRDNRVTYYSRL
ncbi:probable formate dehydrogenase accessory protein FdhD [Psychrobacter arcticus 273-4]|uniref:Sulfur carrier protein FdhD n=1 Tax=Psychrobacter arcticus (strain DSM 17307 / VKM B-2377 / 273-4) TaxID=259536 RepID=Q4FRR7_PSYA2|nr:formate dehydrogenase accessory sulfurtransferase FdhD [Psychrobacter arcticus]AAZ19291.1 probable formate dehydrogenase accessory protein FdhD [Psychrobacter arcticus 273-4]